MKVFLAMFYIFLVVGIYAFYYFLNKKKCKTGPFNDLDANVVKNHITPVLVFSIAFIVYSSLGLLERATDLKEESFDIFIFFLANLLGFVSFLIGYGLDKTFVKKRKLKLFTASNKRKNFSAGICIVFFLAVVFVLLNISSVVDMVRGFGTGASYTEYSIREERTAFSGLNQAFASYFHVCVLLFPFYRCYVKRKVGLIDITIVAVFASWALFSGDRTTLLAILLMAVVIINERLKNINMKFIVIAVILGLFALVLLGHLRRYNSISEMLNMLRTNDLASLLSLKGIGEFRNTTGTLFSYIKSNDGLMDFEYFNVYIRELIIWIPAFFFVQRPLPWAEQYMLDFFPEAPVGTGHGWYILTDGYMAFGLFGIVIEMLLYGMLVKLVYKKFFEKKTDAVKAFLYSYFLLYIFYSVRSSAMITIKNYIITMLPIILIYFVFKKSFKSDMGVE